MGRVRRRTAEAGPAEGGATLIEVVVAAGLGALALGAIAVGVSTVVLSGSLDVNAAQANAVARSIEASILEVGYQTATGGVCPAGYLNRGDVAIPAGFSVNCSVEVYSGGSYVQPSGSNDGGLQEITLNVTPPHGGVTATVVFLKANRPTT